MKLLRGVSSQGKPYVPGADYTDAKSVYSFRLLITDYTGNCLRVRRWSDNATQDIGFSGGLLDTASMETFCSGTNGSIDIWYDQKGNVDLIQTVHNDQPQIVSGGSIIIKSGYPALNYDGAGDQIEGVIGLSGTDGAIFAVYSAPSTEITMQLGTVTSASVYVGNAQDGSSSSPDSTAGTVRHWVNGVEILTPTRDELHTELCTDSIALHTATEVNWSTTAQWNSSALTPFVYPHLDFGDLYALEVLVFDSGYATDKSTIEADTIDYYGIT